jgi:hypothetical protein
MRLLFDRVCHEVLGNEGNEQLVIAACVKWKTDIESIMEVDYCKSID